MRVAIVIAVCLSVAAAAVAAPTSLEVAAAGLRMTVPDGWTAADDGRRCMVVSSDGGVVVVLGVTEAGELAGVLDDMKRHQSEVMSNVRTQRSQYKLNGLDIFEERGTADSREGPCLWRIAVVYAARPVIVYTLTSPSALRANEAAYVSLMHSVRTR